MGQRGSVWFLVGNCGGGSTTRTCAVPESMELFFSAINSVNTDTSNVCGQGPDRIPIEELGAFSSAFIDGEANLSVKVDSKPIGNFHRVPSKVFEVALPEDNVFDNPCATLGWVPAGIHFPCGR